MTAGTVTPETEVGNDFVLKRLIGQGGFGLVYEAEQRSTRQRRAVKILRSRITAETTEALERFQLEATAASRVRSNHVVQVISAGIDARHGAWIAMEFLSGSDLAAWARTRGPMAWPDARRVLQHLCHALGAAHRVGIVHRDLKPENIFLAESTSVDTAFVTKILDFGIAKVTAGTTATTMGIGTLGWRAPEQMTVRSTVSPATDVWALGLVGFFLLTGKHYWLEFNVPGLSIVQELAQPSFESASLRALRLGCGNVIPQGFDAWFARCVAHHGRFENAERAHEALPTAVSTGVSAITVPARRQAAPKHTAGLVVGALVAVGITAGIIAVTGPHGSIGRAVDGDATSLAKASTTELSPTELPSVTRLSSASATLHTYYDDFNQGHFRASRYFAPDVQRYILMKVETGLTVAAIDDYMQRVFPRQFADAHAALVEGSLVEKSPYVFVYDEKYSMLNLKTQRTSAGVCTVCVEMDPNFKIRFLRQFLTRDLSHITRCPTD